MGKQGPQLSSWLVRTQMPALWVSSGCGEEHTQRCTQPGQSIKCGHYILSVHRQFMRTRARNGAGQGAELGSSRVWPGPRVVCTVALIINSKPECPSGQSPKAGQI